MRALLAAACLLLAVLALAPGADARPEPPQCVHGGIEVSVGPVTVRTTCGEGPQVEVQDPSCLPRGTC